MLELNQLSASDLVVGIVPAFCAAAAKAYLADWLRSLVALKSNPSNLTLPEPRAPSLKFEVLVLPSELMGYAAAADELTPDSSLPRKLPNSSVLIWPSLLASNDCIRVLARSWTVTPGIGFVDTGSVS